MHGHMAAITGNVISAYQELSGRLASLAVCDRDAGRMARIYTDRFLAVYLLERMGALPYGSMTGPLDIRGLFAPHPELTRIEEAITPDLRVDIVSTFERMLAGRDMLHTALELLDGSSCTSYGSRARDAGVHYTPLPVARHICERTISSYIAHRMGLKDLSFDSLSLEKLHWLYFTLLKQMRILDSSCGSGIFLEAALETLYHLRARVLACFAERFSGEAGLQADDLRAVIHSDALEYSLHKEIVADNLYGTDIEPYSIEIASVRLKLLLAASAKKQVDLSDIRVNLSCRNAILTRSISLEGETFGDFDVIVGNPPYMRVKSMFSDDPESARLKKELAGAIRYSGLYRYQEGNLNLYKLFIERNLSLLKKNGSMGLIFPASFLNEATSEKLRAHLFKSCEIEEIVEIPERARIFPDVNQAIVIMFLNKSPAREDGFMLRIGAGDAICIPYKVLESLTSGKMEVPLMADPSLEWEMIRQLKSIPPFKGTVEVPRVGTITVGQVDETIDKEFISETPTGDIFVKGIHLKEYEVDLSPDGLQPRWVKKEAFLIKRPSAISIISQPRIIGRNTLNKACSHRLKFAMLSPGYVCSNSIKQIVVTDPEIDPLYLLALLNSSALNWYFELFNDQNNIRNYSIEALPIVRAPMDIQQAFARMACLIAGSRGETREYLDKHMLDAMVFDLYFFNRRHGLISAILHRSDDKELLASLMVDAAIMEQVERIEHDDRFKLIKRATYKR
jgi:Alw26I/Eco31I/Esp3I family type II restriction m6 adenine DNA methyltransferase